MVLYFIILLVAFTGGFAQTPVQSFTYPSNCAPPNQITISPNLPAGTQAPPIQKVPDTFQTRVEANFIDKGYSTVAEEYYDFPNNRAALHILQNDSMDYMVFDYLNNQILYTLNGTCYATDLQFDANNLLFGMKTGISGMPHIYSTSNVLHFAITNGLQYMGRSTIRGIPADHWQSCMTWPQLASNFTLDYYFTAYDSPWIEPDLSVSVPLRAEVQGTQILDMVNKLDQKAKTFHHIYEYFDFRNHIWADESVFETPKGVVCVGRKQTKPVPVLGNSFSWREEIDSQGEHISSQTDIWYNYDAKLLRMDYRPFFAAAPFFTTNPVTEVHDFSAGIAYAIDKALGNCSIIPLRNTSFDTLNRVAIIKESNDIQIEMKTPAQLFFLDNTSYTYEGNRTARGMLCDVFIARRTDFVIPSFKPFNSTFEFYFLNEEWAAGNNVGRKVESSQNIPIQLIITTPDWVGFTATYNLYNFVEEAPSVSVFDVSACFGDESKLPFVVEFEGIYDVQSLSRYTNSFTEAIGTEMTAQGNLSPIRLQTAELHIESSKIYLEGTILGLPPNTAYFLKIPGKFQPRTPGIALKGSNSADCAKYCNDNSILPLCNSFDFCGYHSTCAVNHYIPQDGAVGSTSGQTCERYTRVVPATPSEPGPVTDKIWNAIKDNVYAGNFKIEVGNVTYTATGIDKNVPFNSNNQLPSKAVLSQFTVQKGKNMAGLESLILTGLSVDECAKACVGHTSWICNSFNFCYATEYCILYVERPDENPSAVKLAPLCDLYSRKYTVEYNLYPGIALVHNTAAVYQSVQSEDLCAQLCSNYQNQSCKSFDYCPTIATCFLGKTHFYDNPSVNLRNSTQCNHYSRKYLLDFQKIPHTRLTSNYDVIIKRVPLDVCAKLCVEEGGFNCVGFSYCLPGDSTSNHDQDVECVLSDRFKHGLDTLTTEVTTGCDVYKRIFFDKKASTTPQVISTTSSPSSGTTRQIISSRTSTQSTSVGNSISPSQASRLTKFSGSTSKTRSNVTPYSGRTDVTRQSGTVDCSVCNRNKPKTNQNCSPTDISSQQGGQPSNSNNIPGGAVAGIAVAMLLVGLFVGGIGVFCVIDRYRRRIKDDMVVSFVNRENE